MGSNHTWADPEGGDDLEGWWVGHRLCHSRPRGDDDLEGWWVAEFAWTSHLATQHPCRAPGRWLGSTMHPKTRQLHQHWWHVGKACDVLSSLGGSLGYIRSLSSCQQEHPSAVAAWTPWCGSKGAQVGEVHHMGALFSHGFRSPHLCMLSWTWLCQDTQAGVQSEVPQKGSAAKSLNCLPFDGEITQAPPGPWFIISPVCSLINNSYVNRHIPNPLLPITLATAQQSRPSSLDVLWVPTRSAACNFLPAPFAPTPFPPTGLE